MTEEGEGTEFVPPVTFSEDGSKAEVRLSDKETLTIAPDELKQLVQKGRGFDKQGEELGKLRDAAKTHAARYGDIDKMLAEADDPDAVLARIREAVEPKQDTTDDGLADLFGDDAPKGLTRAQVEELVAKNTDKRVEERLSAYRINQEIDAAIAKTGLPNVELDDGVKVHDVLAEITLQMGAHNQKPYSELVGLAVSKLTEAVDAKRKAEADDEAAAKRAEGGTVDALGRPAALGGKEKPEPIDWDSPEAATILRDRLAKRLNIGQ